MICKLTQITHGLDCRAVLHFGSGPGRNPALFPNPAPAKIPLELDSFAGFEKSIFGILNVRLFTVYTRV